MDRAISLEARRIDLRIEAPFQLGPARIDPPSHEISWGKESRRIQPMVLKVLIALHDKIGQVVSREELIDRCWEGRIVGEDVINRCILHLRRIAAESEAGEIHTVPKAGYRLVGTPEQRDVPKLARRSKIWLTAGLAGAAVGLASVLLVRAHSASSQQPALSVVVAPFSAEPGDLQSRRLATDARNAAIRMLTTSGVSVETQEGKGSPTLLISAGLQTQYGGSIANVRIEDLVRHRIVFARTLVASSADSNNLPDRIGANLAASLSWTGPLILLDQQTGTDPAFTTQLFDQVTNSDSDMLRTFEFVRRNAPNAPHSANAQLALAMDTGFMLGSLPRGDRPTAVVRARTAAERARRLAPAFGDTVIPWCLLHSQIRLYECENRLRAGIAADSDAPFVPMFLADLLNNVGRIDEALKVDAVSFAQDQYVPAKIGRLVKMLEADGDRDEAERRYREGQRLWPEYGWLFWQREWGIIQRGDFDALERFERDPSSTQPMGNHVPVALLAEALRSHSLQRIKFACPDNAEAIRAAECMIAMAKVGDTADAFAIADRLYPARKGRTASEDDAIWLDRPSGMNTVLLTVPATASLRRDPRFLAIAARLGLLDYWRSGRLPDFCTIGHEHICATLRSK